MKKVLQNAFQASWIVLVIWQLVWLPNESQAQAKDALISMRYKVNKEEAQGRRLKDILYEIEEKYGVSILYEGTFVDKHSAVFQTKRDAAKGREVEEVLKELLQPFEFVVKKAENNIYILQQNKTGKNIPILQNKPGTNKKVPGQADATIQGRVTDEKGEGLPGVSVVLKGTAIGVSTNVDGTFSLSVPESGGVLVVSFLGYKTQEINTKDKTFLEVSLASDSKALDEVVVVGYATQKKVSMTSAVSEVKGEDLARRPVSNVQQALQGQLPGLTVTDQGGGPGKSAASMRIRGVTTLNNNNPLVIVDGIEQRLSDVNPDDIESISLLKDASSTSIYGSRAANGVVLITTKRAKLGKVSVSYNGFYALQQSINKPEHMGVEAYMRLQNTAYQNVGQNAKYTEQQIQEHVNATDRIKYPLPNTWYSTVLRTAPQVNHSLAVSGGTENFKARLSLRYQDQEGIIPNSESKIREVRVNTDFKVSPKINVGTDVNYRYNTYLSPVNEAVVFDRMLHGSLWAVPKYPDGSYGLSAQGHNPLMYAEHAGTSRTADDYIVGNIKGEWEILKGLKFTTQFAARMNIITGKNFANSYTIYDYNNPTVVRKSVPLNNLTEIRNNMREFTLNNLLNYSATLGHHTLNALIGYSQIDNKNNSLTAFRQGFYNNEIQSISQGVSDGTKDNGGSELAWGLRSYFGRFNYSYQDKYLFEANGRYDGSSRFLGEQRYSFFPSFSAGWRISEEHFWGDLGNYVNELKFRGSWGKTGNQAVDLYSYFTTLNLLSYSFNGAPVQGYTQQRLANENLTWETTTQTNVGMDAQLLNNRITLGVDYYNKRTEGILLVLPVPGTLGLAAPPQNAGVVDNKGWEFLLGTRNNFGAFGLEANVNFSLNENNVVSLAGTGPYITGSDIDPRYITGEGYPINAFWGYKTAGLFQSEEEIQNYPTLAAGTKPGDVKFLDLNEDGKINGDDMTFLGTTFPKYNFGSNINLTYKAFALNLLFQGAAKVDTRISGALAEMGNYEGFTHEIYTNNYWTPERTDAYFPRPTKFSLINQSSSDRMLIDGSYLRLKNIQLMYQIPASLTQRAFIERMNVYVSGTNLLTFSKLNKWNLDPETMPGRANYYPQTALYTFGVNLQF